MQIFVSYSRNQASESKRLKEFLETYKNRKYEVWYDGEVLGGKIWWDNICERIEKSDFFILVSSFSYWDSPFCKAEYNYAKKLGKTIIPLRANDHAFSRVREELRKLQFIYEPFTLQGGVKIINAIENKRIQARAHQNNETPRPQVPSRRKNFYVLLCGLIPIIGLIVFTRLDRNRGDIIYMWLQVISLIGSFLFFRKYIEF